MRDYLRRVVRILRSPKLALWTVLGVAGYLFIGTVIPQAGSDPGAVISWTADHPTLAVLVRALGLFEAYSSPFFLALIALLTVSTAACAWARTSRARAMGAAEARVTDSLMRSLSSRPETVIHAGDTDDPLGRSADALRSLGLKPRVGPRLVVASSGRWGLLGSPVFHWTLVTLFVVVSLGQLTRAEGMIGIPVGGSRTDQAQLYGRLDTGAWFSGHTGLTITVPRLQDELIEDDIDRGASPEVVLSRGGQVLRQQLVYPNNPLRYGSLLVHRSEIGFSIPVSLESSSGEKVFQLDQLVDLEPEAPLGTRPSVLTLSGLPGGSVDITLTLVPARDGEGFVLLAPSTEMSVGVRASRGSTPATITVPGAYSLADGVRLALGPVVNYARLSVVNDWSVYWIYGLLILGMCGLAVAILVPYRTAWVLRVDSPDGEVLHVRSRHSRRDPDFRVSVENALREALIPAEEDAT